RYIGCSNFLAYRLARAVARSEVLGLARFESVQPRYNLLFREFERELFPLCLDEGIGVIPYNPIAGGLLSGKHDRSKPPEEGTRFTLGTAGRMYQDRYWHDNVFDTVDQLAKLADEAGIPLPTLAVAWTLANPAITAPLVARQILRVARLEVRRHVLGIDQLEVLREQSLADAVAAVAVVGGDEAEVVVRLVMRMCGPELEQPLQHQWRAVAE